MSNVRFMDLIDFAKLFNFNAIDIKKLEYINRIIQNAFLGNNESLNILEKMSNSALYELGKVDKQKIKNW